MAKGGGAVSVHKGLRIKIGSKVFRITPGSAIGFLLIIGLVGFTALPLVYVVSTAFKPLNELFLFPPRFFVRRPTMRNFGDLFIALDALSVPFTRYVFNSIFVTAATVFLTITVSAMAAYGMVKHKVLGGKILFSLVLAGLMFSSFVTQIPTFLIVNTFQMVNTSWALIIPKVAVAYNVFLVKQFTEQLPDSFLEAARIDGAGEFTIFIRIVVPFLKPVLATLVVFSFVANWNDFFSPLVYIQDEALKTLPLALQLLSSGNSIARAGAMAAATFVTILPTILIYTLAQKHVVDSMAFSGIKA